MSAIGGGEGISNYRSCEFNGNDTPLAFAGDDSTVATFDVANCDWEDDSVAGGAGRDGVSARKRGQRIEGVKRDKWGNIIKTCRI